MREDAKTETIDRQRVEDLTTKFAEPTWAAEARLSAYEAYLQTPMPSQRDETWRRADLSTLDLTKLRAFDLGPAKEGRTDHLPEWFQSDLKQFPETSGVLFQTTKNGGFIQLNKELVAKGVIFCDLATALVKHANLVQTFFEKECRQDAGAPGGSGNRQDAGAPQALDKFALMTRAFFNCGFFLYVPKNVEIEHPFVFGIGFSADHGEFGGAIFPRLIVVAEEMSRANVIFAMGPETDEFSIDGHPISLAAGLSEVHVKAGARVSYLEIQDFSDDVFFVHNFSSNVSRDANFTSLNVALGGRQTKSEICTRLQAPGASSEILGAVFGSLQESFNFNTIQEHNAPDTKSDINFRVALKDAATSVYQGIIRVAKVAQRTDAFQSNKNLLLAGDAKADSIPKLEILADDVRCSHGATVGPVDRDQIFYLMSRGLTREEAEELIVLGFFRKVMEKFPLQNIMEWLNQVVVGRKIHNGRPTEKKSA